MAAAIERARAARGVAHVALSGGSTPVRTYELLAQRVRDWHGVQLWFVDERCVPPQDPESNYRLVAELLLAGARAGAAEVPIADEQVHRMEGELVPQVAAARYAQLLREHVAADAHGVPALDLALLGIGPEGHIASLFPASDALEQPDPGVFCIAVLDSPKPPPERITLTLATLCAARRCLLLASGESKAQALDAALSEPSPEAPASLLPRARLSVIADAAAGAALHA
jgi:6-phosphogluconolactonase